MRTTLYAPLMVAIVCACSGTSASGIPVLDAGVGDAAASTPSNDADSSLPAPEAGVAYKSYITLGDSISARGGVAPFFYDLLEANDDARYPEYTGKDFKSLYGASFKVYRRAVGGSTSGDLEKQIQGLPGNVREHDIAKATMAIRVDGIGVGYDGHRTQLFAHGIACRIVGALRLGFS
jgi:hypothetical protein